MKFWSVFVFVFIVTTSLKSVFGIVPKPGVSLDNYAAPAKRMNNVGRLMVNGKKASSCSSALIGIDGDIGIVLTAGHCADLTSEEEVSKCRFQTISFSSDNTRFDPQQIPIIGRAVIGSYVEKPGFIADIGVVFVDLRDGGTPASPLPIALDPQNVPQKSLVQIIGYGKTSEADELRNPRRLAMSTEAVRSQEHGHDVLWLDETEIEGRSLTVPIGDHPAEGDSGGVTINVDTGEVIGVVSHSTNRQDYYSEPLYPHAEWLKAQIKNARRYLVYKPIRSGRFSDNSIWTNNYHTPMSFKNPYGEINPIVEIDDKTSLSFDEGDTNVYAINIIGEGGSIEIQTAEQHSEVLRVYAPSVITSPVGGKLVVDTVKVNHSDFSLQAQLRILHALEVKVGVVMDTRTDSRMRGLTLVDNGNIQVEGTLTTHHIHFARAKSDASESSFGQLHVSGTLEVDEPLLHYSQGIQGKASQPGEIKSDYVLGQKGVLSFNLDTKTPTSSAILHIEGIAELLGGSVSLDSPYVLPIGFEQTLLSAKELKTQPAWRGMYNPKIVSTTSEAVFFQKDNTLIMKIVPISGGVTSPTDLTGLDDLFN